MMRSAVRISGATEFLDKHKLSDGMRMNTSAIITLVVIAGIVWGGFLLITITALRKESRKAQRG